MGHKNRQNDHSLGTGPRQSLNILLLWLFKDTGRSTGQTTSARGLHDEREPGRGGGGGPWVSERDGLDRKAGKTDLSFAPILAFTTVGARTSAPLGDVGRGGLDGGR